MTPQDIMKYWLEMRDERQRELLEKWGPATWIECMNEDAKLGAITDAVRRYVESFKAQG